MEDKLQRTKVHKNSEVERPALKGESYDQLIFGKSFPRPGIYTVYGKDKKNLGGNFKNSVVNNKSVSTISTKNSDVNNMEMINEIEIVDLTEGLMPTKKLIIDRNYSNLDRRDNNIDLSLNSDFSKIDNMKNGDNMNKNKITTQIFDIP